MVRLKSMGPETYILYPSIASKAAIFGAIERALRIAEPRRERIGDLRADMNHRRPYVFDVSINSGTTPVGIGRADRLLSMSVSMPCSQEDAPAIEQGLRHLLDGLLGKIGEKLYDATAEI